MNTELSKRASLIAKIGITLAFTGLILTIALLCSGWNPQLPTVIVLLVSCVGICSLLLLLMYRV